MAGRGDQHLRRQAGDDPARPARGLHGGRPEAEQRSVVQLQARAGEEVLVAAGARVLVAADGVGRHLPVQVDRRGAVDRHEMAVLGDQSSVVDHIDG